MKHPKFMLRTFPRLLLLFALILLTVGSTQLFAQTIPFSDAKIRIEFNSTDQDIGIQVFLDADAWGKIKILAPDGKLFAVRGKGNLGGLGLTELFFESEEPELSELPLAAFLALFPAGEYKFSGKTVDGEKLESVAVLTHNIPDGPVITSPTPNQVVDPSNTVIEWQSVTTPAGIEIVGYQVILEQDDPLRTFSIDLPATANSLRIPSKFFADGALYKVEVLAIELSGNQTISEVPFSTAPAP